MSRSLAYEVFRNGVSLGTTAALSRAITGLTPDTSYFFTVRARDAAANWSEPSAPLAVTTLPDTTAPSVPVGLNATVVSVSTFTLEWTAATDDVRVTLYEVSRDGVVVGTTSGASRNITGLVPATSYTFTVRARDAAGNWSAPSAPLAVTTLADTTPPAVPTGLVASLVTGSSLTLRWTAPKDNVRTSLYEVFRDGVSLGTTTATSRNLTGLFPETEYAMTVRASDAAGNWSDQSLALPVTTLADTVAPSTPAGLVASAITVNSFTLSWTASSGWRRRDALRDLPRQRLGRHHGFNDVWAHRPHPQHDLPAHRARQRLGRQLVGPEHGQIGQDCRRQCGSLSPHRPRRRCNHGNDGHAHLEPLDRQRRGDRLRSFPRHGFARHHRRDDDGDQRSHPRHDLLAQSPRP